MANNTQNFLPADGNWKLKKFPMIASVAIVEGAGVFAVGDGTYSIVTGSTANFVGIMAQPIAATDADYATSLKLKAVWVPTNNQSTAFFTVGTGTFTTADVGKDVVFHTGGATLAVDTGGIQARITEYISSTKGKCQFNVDIVAS